MEKDLGKLLEHEPSNPTPKTFVRYVCVAMFMTNGCMILNLTSVD